MRAGIVNNVLTTMLDEVLKQLEHLYGHEPMVSEWEEGEREREKRGWHLVYMMPLTCFFLHELRVYAQHDLVEVLTFLSAVIGD